MNLIIDIGNSIAKLAVFHKNNIEEVFYDSNRSLISLPIILNKYPIQKGILASVANLNATINNQLDSLDIEILKLDHSTPLPIINEYKTPQTLGSDRIAAVIGAQEIFPDKNILVIDAGTAITYEFLDSSGIYHGGNISPGMQMRFKALNTFTDKLPLLDGKGQVLLMGNDTETAIRSGVIKGIEFEITGYIRHLKNYYPDLLVFLTGGDEFSFDSKIKSVIFADRFLVLKGLNRILNYNDNI